MLDISKIIIDKEVSSKTILLDDDFENGNEVKKEKEKGIKKMKVDDLRNLVIEKKILTNEEEVQKLKKSELIDLLKK